MQDVIFNGSSRESPWRGARAWSCFFDNSLGRARPMVPYAEISVKRVLQRDGESSISSKHSPPPHVQDIFLGTDSVHVLRDHRAGNDLAHHRARPEELRVFLEEAAGVSK